MDDLYELDYLSNETELEYDEEIWLNETELDEATLFLIEQVFPNGQELFRVSFPQVLFLSLAYGVIFLLGSIGNIFVVSVVLRSPRMRTPTNFLIANLAIADLLVIFLCLPFTLIANIYSAWILGQWVCKIVPYLQGVSVSASIDTLIAIALERYVAICYPMKKFGRCRFIIIFIWTFSFTITLPWAIFFKLRPITPGSPIMVCTEQWPNNELGNIYFIIAHLILCYILPLILITIFYALILRRVSMREIPQETKNLSTELLVQRSKMKVIKMLLVVVILFALSWLPLYAIFMRLKFGPPPSQAEDDLIRFVTPMAQWLGSSNSSINPIIYAFFNKKYRAGFKALISSKSCCSNLRVEVSKSASTSRSSNRINLSNQTTKSNSTSSKNSSQKDSSGVTKSIKYNITNSNNN